VGARSPTNRNGYAPTYPSWSPAGSTKSPPLLSGTTALSAEGYARKVRAPRPRVPGPVIANQGGHNEPATKQQETRGLRDGWATAAAEARERGDVVERARQELSACEIAAGTDEAGGVVIDEQQIPVIGRDEEMALSIRGPWSKVLPAR
jgi:hypothetical protein